MMKNTLALCLLLLAGNLSASSAYGVCNHLNRGEYYRDREALCALMQKLGIDNSRADLDWSQIETPDGRLDFSIWDNVIDCAQRYGIEMIAILGGDTPKRYVPIYKHPIPFLRYVREAARHFKGRIVNWEVINEANYEPFWGETPVSAEEYAKLLKAVYPVLKSENPDCRVLFSGLAGAPAEYLNTALESGAGKFFDVMNIHPYTWSSFPECSLTGSIREIRRTLDRHGFRNKPIWISEIGYSSSSEKCNEEFKAAAIAVALAKLGFVPERTTIGYIADSATNYYTVTPVWGLDNLIPTYRQRQELTLEELKTLQVNRCPVVVLSPEESFPMSRKQALLAYLKRGGTLILPQGLPFYFDSETGKQVNARYMPDFHLGWTAWWTSNVPKKAERYEAGEEFPDLKLAPDGEVIRVFTPGNLRKGDRMLPLLYAVSGDRRVPVAALYQFDSDLKGNIITLGTTGTQTAISERNQAELLPRMLLLARAAGAEKVFKYNFRSQEQNNGRESHFGIVRKNMEVKPNGRAYQTLITLSKEGSCPVITRKGRCHLAKWSLPDGSRIMAIWTVFGEQEMQFRVTDGGSVQAFDLFGSPVQIDPNRFTVKSGITYLKGNRNFDLQFR